MRVVDAELPGAAYALAAAALPLLSEAGPQDLANLGWALARMAYPDYDGAWGGALVAAALPKLTSFNAQVCFCWQH